MNVAGVDIGRSAVKAAAMGEGQKHVSLIFPSVVSQAIEISDEVTKQRAEVDTVTVKGVRWFTGETAVMQGRGTGMTGMSDDWIHSATHDALLLSALKKLEVQGVRIGKGDILLLGLPSRLHATQKDTLRESASKLTEAEIFVLPQPMGAYQYELMNEFGYPKAGRSFIKESWGVVDIGHYTTDFMLMMGPNWIEAASGSCPGIHLAAEHLQRLLSDRFTIDLVEAESVLRRGHIKRFGKPVDVSIEVAKAAEPVIQGIINEAQSKIAPYVHKLDGVLVAGGGAILVHKSLEAIWPHTKLISAQVSENSILAAKEARMSVAEGFLRWGLSNMNIRRKHLIA